MKQTILSRLLLVPIIVALSAMIAGCTKESTGLFDSSPSERQSAAQEKILKALTNGDGSWIMEYTPSEQQDFGAFVLKLDFNKDGEVTARAALFPDDKQGNPYVAKSKYEVNAQYGTVLDFSTYNDVINYFADPDIDDGYGKGSGYKGDVSFRIIEGDKPDQFLLQGRMTGNTVRLFRPAGGADAYFDKVLLMRDDALNYDYYYSTHVDGWSGTIGGKNVVLRYDEDGYNKFYADIEGKTSAESVPFSVTPDGVRLINGLNGVTDLKWDSNQKTWTPSGTTTPLTLREDPIFPAYSKYLGEYLFVFMDVALKKTQTVPVTLIQAPRKTYIMEGFPYPLSLSYNREKDNVLLHPQTTTYGGAPYTFVGLNTDTYSFTNNPKHGLETVPNADSPLSKYGEVYDLVDNGLWGDPIGAFVLITPSYQIPSGVPAYFIMPYMLIKIK